MNVHELKRPPNQSLIETLEEMLESARKGDLQAIAWVGIKIGGMSQNGCLASEGTDMVAMLGESYLLMRNIARSVEGDEFDDHPG